MLLHKSFTEQGQYQNTVEYIYLTSSRIFPKLYQGLPKTW